MRPSAIFAPCERCGVFPGARHAYRCLCHQRPGDPFYGVDVERRLVDDGYRRMVERVADNQAERRHGR